MRITIVGCGSIGSRLAKAADDMEEVKRIYLVDIRKDLADNVAASLRKAIVVDSVEDELYHCDLVIEASSQAAAKEVAPKVVARGDHVRRIPRGRRLQEHTLPECQRARGQDIHPHRGIVRRRRSEKCQLR